MWSDALNVQHVYLRHLSPSTDHQTKIHFVIHFLICMHNIALWNVTKRIMNYEMLLMFLLFDMNEEETNIKIAQPVFLITMLMSACWCVWLHVCITGFLLRFEFQHFSKTNDSLIYHQCDLQVTEICCICLCDLIFCVNKYMLSYKLFCEKD